MPGDESATVDAVGRTPTDRGYGGTERVVRWLLCLAIAATMAAHAIRTYRGDGTAINAFLFLDLGWSNEAAARFEYGGMALVLVLTALGMRWPRWYLLAPAGLYVLAEYTLRTVVGGQPFSEWAPAAAALRFATPLVTPFLLLSLSSRAVAQETRDGSPDPSGAESLRASERRLKFWAWWLRCAVAVVFLTHGFEALRHHPAFVDLVIGTGTRMFDVWFEESVVTQVLGVIGIVDLFVAIGLLASPNRLVLGWAGCWGLVTALSRITAYGWGAYPELLMRATHFLVPLALILVYSRIKKP